MRVRAKKVGEQKYSGYYNLVRRKPGDVFDLKDPKHFSEKWMEPVEDTTPKTPTNEAEPLPHEDPPSPPPTSGGRGGKAAKSADTAESGKATAPTGSKEVL